MQLQQRLNSSGLRATSIQAESAMTSDRCSTFPPSGFLRLVVKCSFAVLSCTTPRSSLHSLEVKTRGRREKLSKQKGSGDKQAKRQKQTKQNIMKEQERGEEKARGEETGGKKRQGDKKRGTNDN